MDRDVTTARAPVDVERGGACCTLAGSQPLDPADPALDWPRRLAAAGRDVLRVVIVADGARALATDVADLLDRDRAAGMEVRVVDASSGLPGDEPPRAFGVWDDAVVTSADGSTRAPGAIAAAREAIAALCALEPLDELVLPEPIAAEVPVARALAPRLCTTDCAPYHGAIPLLRALGLVVAPQRSGAFFRRHLLAAAAAGQVRVLIAGLADTSMYRHVLAAYAEAGVTPEVTALDRCRTPLAQVRWLAAERGLAVRTVRGDITGHVPDEPVDVIVSDHVLILQPPEDKARAFAAWHAALAPGGSVITNVRIAPEPDPPLSAEVQAGFVERVLAEAAQRQGLLDLDLAEVEADARAYAAMPMSLWPIPDLEALEADAVAAGFAVEVLEALAMPGRVKAGSTAPAGHRAVRYARIVARA